MIQFQPKKVATSINEPKWYSFGTKNQNYCHEMADICCILSWLTLQSTLPKVSLIYWASPVAFKLVPLVPFRPSKVQDLLGLSNWFSSLSFFFLSASTFLSLEVSTLVWEDVDVDGFVTFAGSCKLFTLFFSSLRLSTSILIFWWE